MPWRTRLSIAARNAESVLPEPVGAATRTCRPAWIAGQARACASVGAAKLLRNQLSTAGWKDAAEDIGAYFNFAPGLLTALCQEPTVTASPIFAPSSAATLAPFAASSTSPMLFSYQKVPPAGTSAKTFAYLRR